MGLKSNNISFIEFAIENTLRFDVNFLGFQQKIKAIDYYTFNELFDIISPQKIEITLLEDFLYAQIGDVSKNGETFPVKLNFDIREIENEDYYKKIEKGDIICVEKGDILVSKVRPNLKKIIYIDDTNSDIYYTSAFVHLRPKFCNKIMFYALRTIFFDNLISISRQGKGYPTIREDDLFFLKFDKKMVDKLTNMNSELLSSITPIENKITEYKGQVELIQKIIDEVFAQKFGFNYDEFRKLNTIRRYNSCLDKYADNVDLRFSAKFHRSAGTYVMNELNRITNKKIKNYLLEPITLGASVSPSDFDETGECYYVSMATIKTREIELDETQLLSAEYSSRKKNKEKYVKKGDIIIARSGVAIGKTALIEEDFKGIFADFTMRVRLINYNSKFAYYYFRSMYFQYLIEIYKKGLQNQNIFPSVIQEFPIPDIALEEQNFIVSVIQKEVDKQNSINAQIVLLRKQIDESITNI